MESRNQQNPEKKELNRREFMGDSVVAAAGVSMGLSMVDTLSANDQAAIRKTRSYTSEMEYRKLGKTGLWVSAVCLGGHWKRVDKMVPGVFKGRGWLSADLEMEGFRKNRREVVSQCIESGINYIDACTMQEVIAYGEALRGRRDSMFLGFSWYQRSSAGNSRQRHETGQTRLCRCLARYHAFQEQSAHDSGSG